MAEPNASTAVLTRCGFVRVASAPGRDQGVDGDLSRWQLDLAGTTAPTPRPAWWQHGAVDRSDVARWVAAYERVWRTAGTDGLGTIFTEDVRYVPSPWAQAIEGLDALASFWDAEREGSEEQFDLVSDVVAVDGTVAVVRVSVDYAGSPSERWRDLWVVDIAPDGRCRGFEEWPFAPSQPDGH